MGIESLQIESLYMALEATKNWFDVYFTFPPAHYIRFTIATTTQLAHSIVMLYRLVTFDHPGWDRDLAKRVCGFAEVLNAVTDRMEQVQLAAGLDYSGDPSHLKLFDTNARKMALIRSWWQAKESAQIPSPRLRPPDPSEATGTSPMNLSSETWLNDMLMTEDFLSEPFDFPTDGSANMPSDLSRT